MVKHSGAEEHDGSEDEEEVGHVKASGVFVWFGTSKVSV